MRGTILAAALVAAVGCRSLGQASGGLAGGTAPGAPPAGTGSDSGGGTRTGGGGVIDLGGAKSTPGLITTLGNFVAGAHRDPGGLDGSRKDFEALRGAVRWDLGRDRGYQPPARPSPPQDAQPHSLRQKHEGGRRGGTKTTNPR